MHLFDLSLEARAEISEFFSLVLWEKRLFHKDILRLSDLYQMVIFVQVLQVNYNYSETIERKCKTQNPDHSSVEFVHQFCHLLFHVPTVS